MKKSFLQAIYERVLVLDGAMGTMLQERGLKPGQSPEELNLTMPEVVAGVHREYREAGADIIVTNTFGGSRPKLAHYGLEEQLYAINARAVAIAREVAGQGAYVAASIGPTGSFVEPVGDCSFDEMAAIFREQALPLIEAGADLITLETFLDIKEIRAAVIAIREISPDIPVIAMLTFDDKGRSVLGTPPEAAAITLEAVGANIVGSNCGLGVDGIYEISRRCGASPAAAHFPGQCRPPGSEGRADRLPRHPGGDDRLPRASAGTRGADHRRLLRHDSGPYPGHREARAGRDEVPLPEPAAAPLASPAAASFAGIGPATPVALIGERINPTGKKPLPRNLKKGRSPISGAKPWSRRARRGYGSDPGRNGNPGDRGGAPRSPPILDACRGGRNCGRDVLVDCLTLTVSAEQKRALETLAAIRLVKERLGVNTVLGVSNISFGLPQRPLLSATFFAMAMEAGLDAAIINPKEEAMMDAYRAAMVLLNRDPNAAAYIDAYKGVSEIPQGQTPPPGAPLDIRGRLGRAIIDGDRENIVALVEEGLREGLTPLEISNGALLPGLEEVGRRFECNRFYLPQVMLSADTMQAAFSRLKEEMKGKEFATLGKILMATVEGDIHDIGKNIVCTLLENHGFEVIDLGKNVAAERIIAEARKHEVDAVGLSALMTTTMAEMQNVIARLKEQGVKTFTMVGGAVVTQDYADEIGADLYAKDAMEAVARIRKLLEK